MPIADKSLPIPPHTSTFTSTPPSGFQSSSRASLDSFSLTTAPFSLSNSVPLEPHECLRPPAQCQNKEPSSDGIRSLRQAKLLARAILKTETGGQEVIEVATKAIMDNPQKAEPLVIRGLLYRNCGINQKAVADFDAALRINPSDRTALLHRAAAICDPKVPLNTRAFVKATEAGRDYAEANPDDRFGTLLRLTDWNVANSADPTTLMVHKLLDANPFDRCARGALLAMQFCQFRMFKTARFESTASRSASTMLDLWPSDKIARSVRQYCCNVKPVERYDTNITYALREIRSPLTYDKYRIAPKLIFDYSLIEQDEFLLCFLQE